MLNRIFCSIACALYFANLALGQQLTPPFEQHFPERSARQTNPSSSYPDNYQRYEDSNSDIALTPGMTPEVWFYLQELRRRDDPKQAVRRKAEFRASQREKRLAARRWFGLSNLRPQVSPIPFMGTYSPHWAGNSSNAFQWNGVGYPSTAGRIDYSPLR